MSPIPQRSDRFHVGRGLTLLALLVLMSGCATSSALSRGRTAERQQDYDRAVLEYTEATRLSPDDVDARTALNRAKLRAAAEHFQRARRMAGQGEHEQALVELELAAELNPSSGDIDRELQQTRGVLRSQATATRQSKTELELMIERARDLPPLGLDLPSDVTMPSSLLFREASSRDVFLSIGRFADVSVAFDPAFRPIPVTVDLRNATLNDALLSVTNLTQNFFRVTAPRTVLVIPDTAAKRREYEEEVVRTFYLSNADLKETMDLLRMVLDARRVSPTTSNNALTIKDTPERIAAAARVLSAIDKARPEVMIDIELLEVDRKHLSDYGLQIASLGSPPVGLDGAVSVATDSNERLTLEALQNLSQSDIILANLPSLYYRLLKTDSNTRTLANPQLRTMEGVPAQARFGERVPVPVTTFSPIATGGTPQQPITSFNYENIGVNIDITPRTHHNEDVTLGVQVAVQTISGVGFGGLPTFGNREINTIIRLRDGETNMLAGLIRDEERQTISGIPGLIDIPFVGRLFARTETSTTQTDIVLTLTPHIVRALELDETDLRAFRVGGAPFSSVGELPLPVAIPTPTPVPDRADAPGDPVDPVNAPVLSQPIVQPPQTPVPPDR